MALRVSIARPALAAARQAAITAGRPCCASRRRIAVFASSAAAAPLPTPDNDGSAVSSGAADAAAGVTPEPVADPAPAAPSSSGGGFLGWLRAQQAKSAALRARMTSLGAAAVLAYGMFDGLTYTIAFTLAWLGYEARTGLNPTQNLADIVKICVLMWAGNNVTRPFRVAGAAAVAPFVDRLMIGLQERLRLPNKAAAFVIIAGVVAACCFSVVGALFVTRWVRG